MTPSRHGSLELEFQGYKVHVLEAVGIPWLDNQFEVTRVPTVLRQFVCETLVEEV